jgi:hypothetical protein
MLTVTATMQVQITPKELAYALMQEVHRRCEIHDDAGCDWMTYDNVTYMGEWEISTNPHIARLVDAANILHYGKPLHYTPLTEDEEAALDAEREARTDYAY